MPRNGRVIITDEFLAMVREHGVATTARLLGRRYQAVRDAAVSAGFVVRRGRRPSERRRLRDLEIRRRHAEGVPASRLAHEFKLSRERVRQIVTSPPRPPDDTGRP